MKLRYHNPSVAVDEEARRLTAGFRLENRSSETWTTESLHLGWQLYDPETGFFIAEGEWSPLAADLAPGQSADIQVACTLPPEKGRYHIYVSPIGANGWLFALGAPFLLIDAAVEHARAALLGHATTTLRGLRWSSRRRSLHKLVTQPLVTIWNNRGLIRSLVGRDISARYRGSVGDVLWTVLNPLLLTLTYFFVFGIVLRARFGGDPSREGFALYFLAGMLPWLPFAEAVGRAPSIVLEHRNFVKKLVFPVEILPVNATLAGLVTQGFALAVFFVFLGFSRGGVPATALWLPVLIVPQLLFTLGVSWLLAGIGVYLRDLSQLIGYLMTLWFFLTPICYPEESLPAAAIPILAKNPIFVLVRGFRDCLLEGSAPAFGPLWKLWLVSLVVFFLGHAFFYRIRKSFADVI